MSEDIKLSELTDEQKALLTKASYIDIDIDKYKELMDNNGSVTVSELKEILSNPDEPYAGTFITPEITDGALDMTVGDIQTDLEVLEDLERAGLGDLQIKDIAADEKTGFYALAYSDSEGRTGISYRGTDLSSFFKDFNENIGEYIQDDSTKMQLEQAREFFEKCKNENGENYVFGHSLGGNLAEHIYLENFEDIANTFVINPDPINEKLLDTDEKINAFNDSDKFDCCIVGGDMVSQLKDYDLYSDNVKYIKNSNSLPNNIIGDHLTESASYDEKGNFILTTKEEAYKGHEDIARKVIPEFVKSSGGKLNEEYSKVSGNEVVEEDKAGMLIDPSKENKLSNKLKRFGEKIKDFTKKAWEKTPMGLISNKMKKSKSEDLISLEENENAFKSKHNDFVKGLNIENYIGENYTREQYENAIEISKNPEEFIKKHGISSNQKNIDDNQNLR